MFEGSLVESTTLLQTHNRWPALLSFAAQALLAVLIVALPLLHPELLPVHAPALSLAPPPAPQPPQPPPPLQHMRAALSAAETPTAPSAAPAAHSLFHTLLHAPPIVEDTPVSTTLGTMTGDSSSPFGVGTGIGTLPSATTVAPAPPAHAGPVHISSGVTAGLLLSPIRPEYPAFARLARTEGTVVIHAVISRGGQIERAEAVSGPPMLQGAALQAVERARYRPYLLNGQPTEVETSITVVFHLGS